MPALDEAAGSAPRASDGTTPPAEAKDWRSQTGVRTQIVYFAGIEVEGVGQLRDLVATAG
jgi:hypothetical protein